MSTSHSELSVDSLDMMLHYLLGLGGVTDGINHRYHISPSVDGIDSKRKCLL